MAIHKENLAPIVKASTTSITLAATYNGQTCTALIGGRFYRLSSQLTLSTATSGALGGLDTGSIAANTLYYVYLCVNSSGVLGLVMSTSSSAPSGSFFSAYKYIGKTKTFSGSTSLVDVNPLFVGDRFDEKGRVSAAWTLYSPNPSINQGLGTVTPGDLSYIRSESGIIIQGRFSTGTVAGSEARLALPGDLTVGFLSLTNVVGKWVRANAGASAFKNGTVIASASTGYLTFSVDDYTTATNPFTPSNGNSLFQNSQAVSLIGVFVPILEYSGLFT